MPARQRADMALVERGLVESRSRAQALILAGKIFSGTRRIDKAGEAVKPDQPLSVKGPDHPWVSRGGLKLAGAQAAFGLSFQDAVAIDVGASTGGFTHVLLNGGAARVYAVDVGRGQLDWSLRNDERVIVLEKTNARYLTEAEIPEPVDWVVCDASFISLTKVLPAALARAKPDARLVALIKPQFEAGRGQVGKGGVVRDPAVHQSVCARISDWLTTDRGWHVAGLIESPIKGPEGNLEFLIYALRAAQ